MREQVIGIIEAAAEELAPSLPSPVALDQGEAATLYGRQGPLDSVGLVNLILLVEEGVADELGRSVTLASERALSQGRSPFRTIGSLADFVVALLQPAAAEA